MFDERFENVAVDRAVDDRRTAHAAGIEWRDQRRRFSMAAWNLREQPLPLGRTPAKTRHVRLGPGLVDEDQAAYIELFSACFPVFSSLRDIGTVLLSRVDRLFLKEMPIFMRAVQTADSLHPTPRRSWSSLSVASGC